MAPWNTAAAFAPAFNTFEWAVLVAVAALAGHVVQRLAGLPKVLGYAVVGALAGVAGLAGATWPLRGVGLFLLELGIAVVLFEAGSRLPLRWFRHNPMVLLQSVAESLLTFAAAYGVLRALGLDAPVVRALAIIAVAASPAVLMRVVADLRAGGPVTDRAIALATLNTLYALTLGTAMLRTIDRGEGTLAASLTFSLTVLGISALVGAVLAAVLTGALRLVRPTSQDTAIVILALVAAAVAAATPLGGSAPLAALLAGLALKQVHPRPWVWPRQLGTAASMLSIVMFVLVSAMAVRGDWGAASFGAALALIAVRAGAKVASLLLTGFGTGMAPRQTLWVGAAMVPMSAVALLLTSQFVSASHGVGQQVAAIALPVILITELVGAVMVSVALVRSGEAAPPERRREPPAESGEEEGS
ncbi:MAG: cation:proton antiporter [Burkholderiales bacterium]|nr:cation:proton antiporter [Burkholderiales bacterium]MBS0401466.1 cation:proton antiporter [Pseudomonadota bacterium]MBS0413918.1 cation:proton antiporter [Pseudomonadota bacterium]HMN58156.1 cation:proton antiporter [Ottowia sp.]